MNESTVPGPAHVHASVAVSLVASRTSRPLGVAGESASVTSLLSIVFDLPPGAVAVTTQRREYSPASRLASDRWVRSPVWPGRFVHVPAS